MKFTRAVVALIKAAMLHSNSQTIKHFQMFGYQTLEFSSC